MMPNGKEPSLFRSQEMIYVRMVVPSDAAPLTFRALGKYEKFHLVDLQRPGTTSEHFLFWKKRVAQCNSWQKKLESFRDVFREYQVPVPEDLPIEEHEYPDVLDELKNFLDPLESSLSKNILFKKQQAQILNEMIEHEIVLRVASQVHATGLEEDFEEKIMEGTPRYGSFAEHRLRRRSLESQPLLPEESASKVGISQSLFGIIPTEKQIAFERLLFRMSRGNAIIRFFPLEERVIDAYSGEPTSKVVFNVVFLGQQLRRRISKLCQFFGATEYTVPVSPKDVLRERADLSNRIVDLRTILARTDAEIKEQLFTFAYKGGQEASQSSPWLNWCYAVQCEAAIADAIRHCQLESESSHMLCAEGWLPADEATQFREVLQQAVFGTNFQSAAVEYFPAHDLPASARSSKPPSYFKTNRFTETFQNIVNTYGIPRYQEVNPGLFTIVSFPFLFGVMFGDVGHGLALTLFSLYLVLKEKKFLYQQERGKMNEIFSMAFSGRYMLLLMGLFATYNGFIYNDCVSLPMYHMGTNYDRSTSPAKWNGKVVPFGMDPAWYYSSNELEFFNSFKMKTAVTLGVVQMVFGLILSLQNHLFHRDKIGVFLEFVPRLVFLLATFGYMIFLIVYKYTVDWSSSPQSPPSLIQVMIAMFLSPTTLSPDKFLYKGQSIIQPLLLFLALISIPVMLLGPPIALQRKWKKIYGHSRIRATRSSDRKSSSRIRGSESSSSSYSSYHQDDADEQTSLLDRSEDRKIESIIEIDEAEHQGDGYGFGPNYSFSEHLITNSIHTIEYVLGCVSNTASYLRLWALSLAHAQLASVFWTRMVIQYGINTGNPFMIVVGVGIWAVASFAVLMCMDALECFLHALRLHWVEFQNKFYYADGIPFTPFSLTKKKED